MTILEALDRGKLEEARDLLLQDIYTEVGEKRSWDSPQYCGNRIIQNKLILDKSKDKLFTYFGLEVLKDRYFLKDANGKLCETPQDWIARVSAALSRKEYGLASALYDIISHHWFMPATPILSNIATNRALPISCFLNLVPDDVESIFDIYKENAVLAKNGGGIGTCFSDVRGLNAKLKTGGKSSGIIPFLKIMDSATLAISQAGVRRGSAAVYLDINHPDIEEFVDIRKPTGGDENRRCLNLHNAVNVTDKFMEAVRADTSFDLMCPNAGTVQKTIQARDLWKKILKNRMETGEPYLLFIDTVNKAVPAHHAEKGLFIKQSNLCSEITLPTDTNRTAVCCLGSLNLEKWDDFSPKLAYVINAAVRALDNTLDIFIKHATSDQLKKAVYSATQERSIGLGVMGWHGYLMKNSIPFGSPMAYSLNNKIFKSIKEEAVWASADIASNKEPCPDGGSLRNSYLLSIAPTANISVIAGNATPCIEPITGNAYMQKTLSGTFLVKNSYLEKKLDSIGNNTPEIWESIIVEQGSVQHLTCLNDEDKAIFKTAYEINMEDVIRQAADRQQYICQSQSLNLFFSAPVDAKYLNKIHLLAHELGCKSLYYLRSNSLLKGSKQEECAACQ